MHRRGLILVTGVVLSFLLRPAGALPLAAQDGGGGAPPPPPPDLRFFPKELEDALKELQDPEADQEQRFDAMRKVARMRGLDGAEGPLKKDAWEPVMGWALRTYRHDTFAAMAGEFLAALDPERLASELKKAAGEVRDAVALRNATFLAEALGDPRGTEILAGPLSQVSAAEVRVRVAEAFGILRAKEGLEFCLALLRDSDPEIRSASAIALGRIGSPKAVPALLQGMGVKDGYHGWYCAHALGRIEDPDLFGQVLASGAPVEVKAKALEECARPRHLDDLVNLVQKGSAAELRIAAANALRRLVGNAPASQETIDGKVREAAAEALLEGMVSDREETVRGACFWALRKVGVESTGPRALQRIQTVKGDDKLLYLITILGERKVKEAAPLFLRALAGTKEVMLRRAMGVAFWQIDNAEAIGRFEEFLLKAKDAGNIQNGCEWLGSWRTPRGFDLALKMLRSTREGSREQFEVLLALEKMTGHFFGPYPGVWNKWFEKNPEFFTPHQSRIEREKWREDFDKENKGFRHTKETERAVQMGLAWLASHQAYDGQWDATRYQQHCDPREPCSRIGGARTQFAESGYTGLSCLAFTGAGYLPSGGKYRHTLERGLVSLMATMGVEGDYLRQADYLWNRSYARSVALQALAEAYAVTGEEPYRLAAERIVARQFALMNERGGWRYAMQRGVPELDSSVTAWAVFALKASEKAGIDIPRLLWEGPYLAFDHLSQRVPADPKYYEELVDIDPDYGYEVGKDKDYTFQTGYDSNKAGPGRATTPLGLMSRIFLGWRRSHPFCIGSANYVVKYYLPEFDVFGEPGKEDWSRAGRFTPKALWVMYNFYYCTLAMHQMGGRFFYQWNRRISRFLPHFQQKTGCARGSWPSNWGTADDQQGWVYTTCMGVLTLETYYRYLPVLQD